MKKIKLFTCLFLSLLLYGCGHTMYHKVEGTGVYGRIPLPNGSSLVQVAVGDLTIASGALRGGAVFDQSTSKGGTLGSISLGRHTHISTIPAINEGNIEKVLTSENTDSNTKQLIALYLLTRKTANAPTAATTSVNSASATGQKAIVKPTKVGIDNIVDKTGDTITQIAPVIKDGTVKVVDSASKSIQNSIVQGTHNWKKIFDNLSIITITICVSIVIVAFILFSIIIKRKNEI